MISSRNLLLFVAFGCFGALGVALYLQHGTLDMLPCPLCVIQRYLFLAVAFACLFGAYGGRPQIGAGLGLAAALEHLAQEFTTACAVPVRCQVEGSTAGLDPVANTTLFRIAQEALTNIERHAKASFISIDLTRSAGCLMLCITDDGCGFDAADVAKHPQRGIGLRNMIERMDALGGELHIDSGASGTSVWAVVILGA